MGTVLGYEHRREPKQKNKYQQLPRGNPKELIQPKSNQIIKNDFKLFVAMDLGTDGFGLAYCLAKGLKQDEDDDDVIIHKWEQRLSHFYMKKSAQILI